MPGCESQWRYSPRAIARSVEIILYRRRQAGFAKQSRFDWGSPKRIRNQGATMPEMSTQERLTTAPHLEAASAEDAIAIVNRWLHREVGMALHTSSATFKIGRAH